MIAAVFLAAGLVFSSVPSPAGAEGTPVVDPQRQATLVEMRERGILGPSSEYWRAEDVALLNKLRRAETNGAFDLIREELGTLRGMAVEHRASGGPVLRLTKRGYDRYEFLKSQKARQYFEDQGVEASRIFKLKDPLDKRLFTTKGILTPEGEDLYDRAALGIAVRWMDESGKIQSSDSPRQSTTDE